MAPNQKLITRLKRRPRDFRWGEPTRLLRSLGYEQVKTGRTAGSRRRFVHPTAPVLMLHQPHPGSIVKVYVVDELLRVLTEEGLIR